MRLLIVKEVVHLWVRGVYGNYALSAQFCCEPKAALKSKAYLKGKHWSLQKILFYVITRPARIVKRFYDFISQTCYSRGRVGKDSVLRKTSSQQYTKKQNKAKQKQEEEETAEERKEIKLIKPQWQSSFVICQLDTKSCCRNSEKLQTYFIFH